VLHGNVLRLTPVIVYQMAKVGSSAIHAALRRARMPVFHVHRLSAKHLERVFEERRALGWHVQPLTPHQRHGLAVHDKVIATGQRAKIITLVRDPIARNLSAYFESIDEVWNTKDAHAALPMDDLRRGFLDRYTHDEPLTWFDDEFLPILGVDVYEHPFPAEGHTTIRTDRYDILILRAELSDDVKHSALSSFLGKRIPPLQRENTTRDKAKGAAYEEFRRTIRLPEEYVRQMKSSKYYRHFYG
jgi:hypothetical protein